MTHIIVHTEDADLTYTGKDLTYAVAFNGGLTISNIETSDIPNYLLTKYYCPYTFISFTFYLPTTDHKAITNG